MFKFWKNSWRRYSHVAHACIPLRSCSTMSRGQSRPSLAPGWPAPPLLWRCPPPGLNYIGQNVVIFPTWLYTVHGQCCQPAENSVKKLTGGSRKMSVGREKYLQIVSKGPSCRKVYKKISDIFCEKSYRYILHYLVIAKYSIFLDRYILYKKLHFTTSSDFFHSFGRIFSLILVESLLGSGNSVGLSG